MWEGLVCEVTLSHLNHFSEYSCMKLSNKVISDLPCVCFNCESLTQKRPNELFITIVFLVRAWFVPAKSFIPLFPRRALL